ncbi:MAG: hypothetical protein Q9227_008019 [Pyrenula ochraceoflavens]
MARNSVRRRYQSTAAVTAHSPSLDYVHVTPNLRSDDADLKAIFDNQSLWRDTEKSRALSPPIGLLQNRYLTSPEGWDRYAHEMMFKCKKLADKVTSAKSVPELRAVARDIDQLSDRLCRVVDVADFARTFHRDKSMAEAAKRAYFYGLDSMNTLNTSEALSEALDRASEVPEIWEGWSQEERLVVDTLRQDFKKSATTTTVAMKKRFVQLNTEIAKVGTEFAQGLATADPLVGADKSELEGLEPAIIQKHSIWRSRTIGIPTYCPDFFQALRTVHSEETRKQLYKAMKTASSKQIRRLESLIQKRAEKAKIAGFPDFATLELQDKMAKTPQAVMNFLESLSASNRAGLNSELSVFETLKKQLSGNDAPFKPWDHLYLLHRLSQQDSLSSKSLTEQSSMFSVGTAIQGLSRLFNRLYGLRFVPAPVSPGETWHPSVRRLDVISDTHGHAGVIYCDLFSRENKQGNPTHYTLRCSREITTDEISESSALNQHPNDGLPTNMAPSRVTGQPALHQLPVIALVCNFSLPSSSGGSENRPSYISHSELSTLYHEMGHAIHSLLARTSLQTIAGTRVSTDFSELPSILMESFARDPAVLSLLSSDSDPTLPIPTSLITHLLATRRAKAQRNTHWDIQTQICNAMLDMAYHTLPASEAAAASSGWFSRNIDSTAIYHDIWARHGPLPEPEGTAWQGLFGHLDTYGAAYYSYLFDQAIAGRVWEVTFKGGREGGGVSRENGERFKQEVLGWGGGRSGWECLEGLLGEVEGEGVLGEGGERAMRRVGEWGVRET